MDKKVWLSRRAVKLHVVILIVVPAFLALCLWQISRAARRQHPQLGLRVRVAHLRRLRRLHVVALRPRGGGGHVAARAAGADPGGPAASANPKAPAPAGPAEQREDAELAAYNDYLAQLAERDKATGR